MLIPKKYHIHVIALLAVAAILTPPLLGQKVDPKVVEGATQSAEIFLALVDAGDFEAAREEASELLRDRVDTAVWHRQIGVMRERVGALKSRTLDEVFRSSYAQDAPKGDYLTLEYRSDFAKTSQVLETVNLRREDNDRWRVAGYFIK